MNVLVIISIYVVIPGPLLTKIVTSVIFSTELILALYTQEQTPIINKTSILTGIIITNLLGFYSWSAITQFRRRQFHIHMELQQAKQNAEFLARTDPLTEISNRRAFMERGCKEFSRARRYQRLLSLALIDIDDFKSINDQYGHQVGDLVLNKFCQLVTKQIREQDVLGRIGGDEFGLLLPETTLEEAQVITARLCETFRQTIIELQGKHISTSFSAGLVTTQPSDQSFEQLLQRTDQKLYQAKKTGKDRIEI